MNLLEMFALIIVGLGGGLAVGSGFVAFITVLDIIPRLTQLAHAQKYVRSFEWSLITGTLWTTLSDFFQIIYDVPRTLTIFFGVLAGVFVGTLAAGLTEALNVFPILAKRLGMDSFLLFFLMAMVLGKMVGSVLQWILQL